jgi:hypothetical protein
MGVKPISPFQQARAFGKNRENLGTVRTAIRKRLDRP